MALIGKNLKDKLSTFTKKCNQKFFEELWQEISKLQNADNAMDNRALVLDSRLTALEKQTAELSESLDYRLYAVADRLSEKKPAPPPASTVPAYRKDRINFEKTIEWLKSDYPEVFTVWKDLFDAGTQSYDGFPLDSCSSEGKKDSEIFKRFLKLHLHGNVLDVGCGPQGVPYYLSEYPADKIFGIDPLQPAAGVKRTFKFEQALCEHIPWDNDSFDCVIFGTSLDHVMLLDKSLSEVKRVLKLGGLLIIQTSLLEGFQEYNPFSPEFEPADKYHMFHFDKPWFEKLFDGDRDYERVDYARGNFAYLYVYRLKNKKQQ